MSTSTLNLDQLSIEKRSCQPYAPKAGASMIVRISSWFGLVFILFSLVCCRSVPQTPTVHKEIEDLQGKLGPGLKQLGASNWDEAISEFNKVISHEPRNGAAYFYRATCYFFKGDLDRALDGFNKAIQIDPTDVRAYGSRAFIYGQQNKTDQAIADYSKAIQLFPEAAGTYSGRGAMYLNQHRIELALADFDKAIQINPKYAQAYNNRGSIYEDQGKYDQALADYTKAIELDPKYATPHNGLASIWIAQGGFDEAISECEKALALGMNPAFISLAYYNCGFAYYKKGNYAQAITHLNMFLENAPISRETQEKITEAKRILVEIKQAA